MSSPYIIKASDKLFSLFSDLPKGITATAAGFYGPQGRTLRIKPKIIGLEDKIMNMFAYSSTRIVITDEKINDYKVIYLRHRDYGVNEPGECPYSSGKCTYDKIIQTYKCSGY